MKKIILVNNGTLPLPGVKGGATESLIDLLLAENERAGKYQFEVYSISDSQAQKAAQRYQHATFRYYHPETLCNKLRYWAIRLVNFVSLRTGGYYHSLGVFRDIVKQVRRHKNEYEAILLEGAQLNSYYLKKHTGLSIVSRFHNRPTTGLRQFDRYSYQSTDVFIGISKYICEDLRNLKWPHSNRIELLYNSVDFSLFTQEFTKEQKSQLRRDLGFSPTDFVVMFSGRIVEYKGVKQLLEAFLLLSSYPNLKLLIVGSAFFSSNVMTDFQKSLCPLIEKLKDRVVFTGFVKHEEIHKYYKIADLCAFPSTWEEPFALTCLEAMVCAKPAVITNSGGMPEVVDSDCAVIVPNDADLPQSLASAFLELINRPDRLKSMSLAAQLRANRFSPEKHYQRFVEIMNSLKQD